MGSRERRVKYDRDVLGGEGSDEVQLFRHLCSLYLTDSTKLEIRDGHGGKPKCTVQTALRHLSQLGAYRRRMMVFDGDKAPSVVQDGVNECKKEPAIECLVSDNRFEAEMGVILGCDAKSMMKLRDTNSEVAKQEFKRICPPCENRYGSCLTKDFLEEKRKESQWLDTIITFIEDRESNE